MNAEAGRPAVQPRNSTSATSSGRTRTAAPAQFARDLRERLVDRTDRAAGEDRARSPP